MAAQVVPLQTIKLAQGPAPMTAEQRYWKSFKNQKSHTSTASWGVTHISFPAMAAAYGGGASAVATATTTAATKQNDLFAVTAGPRVDIYSIRKRELIKTIGRFESVARSGEIRPDGRVLVAGDDSGKMQVFDVAGGSRPVILKTWHTHKQPTWVTRWSPTDLTTLMSASDDKTVRLWSLPLADSVRTFVGHQDYVRAGAFMPGGGGSSNNHMLVTGSYDATVRLWDARAPGGAVLTFKHAAPIESVLPMPSGTAILAASDNAVSVLDVVAARPLKLLTAHQKTVTSLCLASHGERVVSGGLDGHVKVFETGSWNVVASAKYPSPVLSVSVISAGAGGDDRHLAVGMVSGVLSIRTRLTGPAAEREKERKKEKAARDAGTLDKYDAAKAKRKQMGEVHARMDGAGGDNVDFVIDGPGIGTNNNKRPRREPTWHRDLRHQRFGAALDAALDPQAPNYGPLNTLTLLTALRHRSALRDALENRDEVTVQPILQWVCRHIVDPRYTPMCTDVGLHLLDLYAEYVAASAELDAGFQLLWKRVRREVEQAQLACQTSGMVESLMMSAMA
ncbi:U3 small nucleolar RNA-associated protein 15 [Sporothrix eucalyptigena]|uniref:U3 small nucleolar RNA-associated protein 15 n=1 Tax=Sporothrix eucalyptigena TaxID=1812306 RepID=A0ABP0CLS2_9PEZI